MLMIRKILESLCLYFLFHVAVLRVLRQHQFLRWPIGKGRAVVDPMAADVSTLHDVLDQRGIDYEGFVEKRDLVDLVKNTGGLMEIELEMSNAEKNSNKTDPHNMIFESRIYEFQTEYDMFRKTSLDSSQSVWIVYSCPRGITNRPSILLKKEWIKLLRKLFIYNINLAIVYCSWDNGYCHPDGLSVIHFVPSDDGLRWHRDYYNHPFKPRPFFQWLLARLSRAFRKIGSVSERSIHELRRNSEARNGITLVAHTERPNFFSYALVGSEFAGSFLFLQTDSLDRTFLPDRTALLLIAPDETLLFAGDRFLNYPELKLFLKTTNPRGDDIASFLLMLSGMAIVLAPFNAKGGFRERLKSILRVLLELISCFFVFILLQLSGAIEIIFPLSKTVFVSLASLIRHELILLSSQGSEIWNVYFVASFLCLICYSEYVTRNTADEAVSGRDANANGESGWSPRQLLNRFIRLLKQLVTGDRNVGDNANGESGWSPRQLLNRVIPVLKQLVFGDINVGDNVGLRRPTHYWLVRRIWGLTLGRSRTARSHRTLKYLFSRGGYDNSQEDSSIPHRQSQPSTDRCTSGALRDEKVGKDGAKVEHNTRKNSTNTQSQQRVAKPIPDDTRRKKEVLSDKDRTSRKNLLDSVSDSPVVVEAPPDVSSLCKDTNISHVQLSLFDRYHLQRFLRSENVGFDGETNVRIKKLGIPPFWLNPVIANDYADDLPVKMFHEISGKISGTPSLFGENGSKFFVCQSDYASCDDVCFLPCCHGYHRKCVVDWLAEAAGDGCHTCPRCDWPAYRIHNQKRKTLQYLELRK